MKFTADGSHVNERSRKVSFSSLTHRRIAHYDHQRIFSMSLRGMWVFERDIDVKKGLNSRDLIKVDVVRTKEVSLSSLQTQSAFFLANPIKATLIC